MKVGDEVTRMLAGTIPMQLKITEITDERIVCGWWEFDRKTGLEIDEDLGWGPEISGSYLVLDKNET